MFEVAASVIAIALAVIVGLATYIALDIVTSGEMRWNRVGGLTHWRFGRFGGTFYRKAR